MATIDRRTLEQYKKYRGDSLKANKMWIAGLRPHLILVGGTACLAIYEGITGKPTFSLVMIGFTLGVLIDEYRWWKINEEIWPTVEQIINWERVDELLETETE